MSYKEIFIVLIVGFGLGYIFGIEVDPKIFPQEKQSFNSLSDAVDLAEEMGMEIDLQVSCNNSAQKAVVESWMKPIGFVPIILQDPENARYIYYKDFERQNNWITLKLPYVGRNETN